MTVKRAAAWLGGSSLLAAWLAAAAAPSLAPASKADPQQYQPPEPDRAALELSAEAERLNGRLSVTVAPRPVTRNPFLFAVKVREIARAPIAGGDSAPTPIVPAPPPPVKLLGIAEETNAPHSIRTAILSIDGELLLVKEGEMAGARYRVVTIGADAIELLDTVEPRTIRIGLP